MIMEIHTYNNWLYIKNTHVHLVLQLITLKKTMEETRLAIPYA